MRTLEQADAVSQEDRALLAELSRRIHEFAPAARVFLYGSVARGTQEPDSDYDILVLTDEPLPKSTEQATERAILALESEREVVFSTIYYSRNVWDTPILRVSPFRADIERDGVLL